MAVGRDRKCWAPLWAAVNEFVALQMEERVTEERRLREAIPHVPDLQCAWQILLQSAGPRANHTSRTLPPKLSADYAQGQDESMWNTAKTLLGEVPGSAEAVKEAECAAKLPMRM